MLYVYIIYICIYTYNIFSSDPYRYKIFCFNLDIYTSTKFIILLPITSQIVMYRLM